MFRYIALAWSDAPGAAGLAHALSAALRAQPEWQVALSRQGLHAFTTGTQAGINQAYTLHAQRGVVLGRLFPREQFHAGAEEVSRRIALDDQVISSSGRALLQAYWGRYVALFESPSGEFRVLRDPSATLPCFRLEHHGVTIVFSWLEDVLTLLPQIPAPGVDREGVAAYMAFRELSGRQTALQGVTQVLPGECVTLASSSETASQLLWDPAAIARDPLDLSPADAQNAVRDLVASCVQAWSSCYDSILLRLSGGVDSSILASCLSSDRTPSRVTCLNYHSTGSDSDEREYARRAASMAGRELIEYERNAGFRLERILDVARTPVPCNYVGRIASASDAEVASAAGARAMFSGAGGDQLFFEVSRWWPAADYLRLRGLDRGFLTAALDAALLGKVSVWRALRLAVSDRFRRTPPEQGQHKQFHLFTDAVRQRARSPGDFVHPVFLVPSGLPIGKLMQVQQLVSLSGYYDAFTRDRAPELVTPLLSQPLIELCLRLPTYVLVQGGRGRALLRTAFKGAIPQEIEQRRSKGGMEEHVKALLDKHLDFARELLLDGELVRLGLIDRAATEAALGARRSEAKSHPNEVHVCLGIEAWLRRYTP